MLAHYQFLCQPLYAPWPHRGGSQRRGPQKNFSKSRKNKMVEKCVFFLRSCTIFCMSEAVTISNGSRILPCPLGPQNALKTKIHFCPFSNKNRRAFGPTTACRDPLYCVAVKMILLSYCIGTALAQKLHTIEQSKSPWRPFGAPRLDFLVWCIRRASKNDDFSASHQNIQNQRISRTWEAHVAIFYQKACLLRSPLELFFHDFGE